MSHLDKSNGSLELNNLNINNNNNALKTWEIYSIPLLLLFLVVTGNFIGQLLPCQIQTSLTNNMYIKHLVAFLILLFVIEIGERKYNTFYELFSNTLIVYVIFLLAIRMNSQFFMAFLLVIIAIYTLYLYKEKQTDSLIIQNVSKITNILYYIVILVLFIGVLESFIRNRKKYGNKFNFFTFFFGSECQLREKHSKI